MKYVYILQSESDPERRYTGITDDLKQRLETHNSGGSVHTAQFRPWRLVMYLGFSDSEKAEEFEIYLKSQSGRAFAKKHF